MLSVLTNHSLVLLQKESRWKEHPNHRAVKMVILLSPFFGEFCHRHFVTFGGLFWALACGHASRSCGGHHLCGVFRAAALLLCHEIVGYLMESPGTLTRVSTPVIGVVVTTTAEGFMSTFFSTNIPIPKAPPRAVMETAILNAKFFQSFFMGLT